MKNLVMIAVLLAGAMSAQAKLGDTLLELRKRFGYEVDNSGIIYTFRLTHYSVLAVVIDNRSVAECYISYVPLVNGEPPTEIVRGILDKQSPRDKWHSVAPPYDSNYAMQNRNDSITSLLRYRNPQKPWSMEIGYTSAIVWLNGRPAQPQSRVTPDVQSIDPSRTPNDCNIIAAQAYARLKPNTYWCQIMALRFADLALGHTVVIYKMQPDGHVFLYDAAGTQELDTTEEALEAIQAAIQARLSDTVESLRYLTH